MRTPTFDRWLTLVWPLPRTTLQVAFGFGASLHVLGVGISVGPLGLDTSGVPWNDVVDALKDKMLEPLTGTRSIYSIQCIYCQCL